MPKALIRNLSCFATSKYLSLLYLGETLPLSCPLFSSPGHPFCSQLASSFLAKRTQLGMSPIPSLLAPLGQEGQDSRNCPRILGQLKQRTDNLRVILRLCRRAGNKQCHFTRPLTKSFHLLRRSTQTTVNPLDHVTRRGEELGLSPAENQLRFIDP